MEGDWGWLRPGIEYLRDPHTLAWISEYKARKLVQRVDGVNMRAARHIVENKMEKHHIRIQSENLQATLDFLADQGLDGQDFIPAGNDTFFFRDLEVMTAVKLFYS